MNIDIRKNDIYAIRCSYSVYIKIMNISYIEQKKKQKRAQINMCYILLYPAYKIIEKIVIHSRYTWDDRYRSCCQSHSKLASYRIITMKQQLSNELDIMSYIYVIVILSLAMLAIITVSIRLIIALHIFEWNKMK